MRRAALGVLQAVLVGTAVVAAAVLAVRLVQQGAPPDLLTAPDATAPSQEALRSSAGVILLTGLLAGMAAASATAWLALAPLDSWFRRGGLALVSAFGTVLAMLVLVPVDQAFGPPGLGAVALLLLIAAVWLGHRFRRAEI
jgi:hypothetical protein